MKQASITIQLPARLSAIARLAWLFRKKHYTLDIPEGWQELQPRQRKQVLRLHLRRPAMSAPAFRILLLKALLRIPDWILYKMKPLDLVEKLLHLVEWAEEASIEKPFRANISIGPFPWRIPAPLAADMPLHQYLLCEREYNALMSGRASSSAPFMAALLRPDTPALRERLFSTGLLPVVSAYELAKYAATLAAAAPEQVFYLVQYYATQRHLLKKKYPNIHQAPKDAPPAGAVDWDSIAPRIAEVGVFGTLEQVLRTPTVSYLAWANAKAEPEKPKSLQEIIQANHQKFMN